MTKLQNNGLFFFSFFTLTQNSLQNGIFQYVDTILMFWNTFVIDIFLNFVFNFFSF